MTTQIQTLNSISPVYHGILTDDRYTVGANVTDPEAIIVRSADMHGMDIGDRLLCVGRAGAGVNNIPLDEMARNGIVVFNSPGANANAVKEMVAAALLLASRKISDGIAWCAGLEPGEDFEKTIEKGKKQFTGPELSGKTLGVVGLGAIGVLVANMGVALGMNVLGYDPFISVDHAWKLSRSVKHSTDLSELYANSDYVTLHLPLMDSTRNTVDANVLSHMKPGAALINYARGGLVNTQDVIDALKAGTLRKYVTDFPCPELLGVKNVVLTPHLGASTPESEDNCVRMVAKQIDEYLRYGSIVNSVNYPNCPLAPNTFTRVTALHANVPNVIGSLTQVFTAEGLNIENMVNQSRGAAAYTAVDLDGTLSESVLEKLRTLPNVWRVRCIMPQR